MQKKWLGLWIVAALLAGPGSVFAQAEEGDAPAGPRARTRRPQQQQPREALTEEQREAMRQQRMERMRERQAQMTDEERQAMEARRLERQQQWESMSEEERRAMRERMGERRREPAAPGDPRPERGAQRPQPPRRPAGEQQEVEQGALRDATREALQRRRQWVLERYDGDGDGMLNEEERAALRRDLQAHMQKFFQ